MAMIVSSGNGTSVSIALPTIGRDLGIPESRLQWLVSSYSLTSGCFLLLFGRLADIYGRKRTFICGTIFLLACTLACSFAKDEITLDVLRGLQGIGTAATIPASLGVLASAFPPSHARTLAFASFAAGAPIGAAFGMALGGLVTQATAQSWRATFYLFSALDAICLVGGVCAIPRDERGAGGERVDWLGAGLVTAGLVLIVFVLAQGEQAPHRWATSYIIACLILGVFLLIAFLLWQWYLERPAQLTSTLPSPLMPLTLWKRAHGKLAAVMWIAFLNWACFISWSFWLQLYYQNYARLSPISTMVRLLPMFITGIICNILIRFLAARVPIPILLGTGTLLTASAALLSALSTSHPSTTYWAFGFPSAVLSVFGADFVFAAGTLFVAAVVGSGEQSLAGALFQTMTQLGTALGLTVTSILFDRVAVAGGGGDGDGQVLKAYRAAQFGAFGFGMIATLVVVVCLRGVGTLGAQKEVFADVPVVVGEGVDKEGVGTS